MHKIVEKERELQNIEIALEKNRSLAKEGHENEQVFYFIIMCWYSAACCIALPEQLPVMRCSYSPKKRKVSLHRSR